MSFTTLLLSKAKKELADSYLWYEERQIGLGERFASEVFKKIAEIEDHPDRYPVKVKGFREARVAVFP